MLTTSSLAVLLILSLVIPALLAPWGTRPSASWPRSSGRRLRPNRSRSLPVNPFRRALRPLLPWQRVEIERRRAERGEAVSPLPTTYAEGRREIRRLMNQAGRSEGDREARKKGNGR